MICTKKNLTFSIQMHNLAHSYGLKQIPMQPLIHKE